jgi:hypothetical protein
MLKHAEKPDFADARAVRVCQKVMIVSDMRQKKPYIYGISREIGHGIDFSCPCGSDFYIIVNVVRRNYVF